MHMSSYEIASCLVGSVMCIRVRAKAVAPALAQALRTRLQSPGRVSARTLELVTRHFGRAAVHDAYDAVYRMALR
jgi:hypothetical protein